MEGCGDSQEASQGDVKEYVCRLPMAARLYAAQVLRERESRRIEDIEKIQHWLQTQSCLHARTDSINVLRFLRGCKFNEERTRHKITNYYIMRTKVPEWFKNRDPLLPQLQEMLNLGVLLPLKQRSTEGQLIILVRAAVHDPHKQLLDDLFKAGHMVVDALLEEDEQVSIYGVLAIFDLAGVTMGHAKQLTPTVIGKAVHSWQNCYPVRIKGLVFINAPLHVSIVLSIFKRFMSEKMRSRVKIYHKGSDYRRGISRPELLPVEYGGEGGEIKHLIEYWKERVVERRAWFLQDEAHKADLNQNIKK